MAAYLIPSELYKYEWRVQKFIDKYQNNEQFECIDNVSRKFIYSEDIIKYLREKDLEKIQKPILLGEDGQLYRFGELKKTKEFGGKGKDFSIRLELYQIELINKQLEKIKWDIVLNTHYSTKI